MVRRVRDAHGYDASLSWPLRFASQTTRAIYRLVEAGRVHFTDGPEG